MPDLGKYALEVSLSYAGSLVLLIGLVALSILQSRRARRMLQEAEDRKKHG